LTVSAYLYTILNISLTFTCYANWVVMRMSFKRVFFPIISVTLILCLLSGAGCDLITDSSESSENGEQTSETDDGGISIPIDPDWQLPTSDGQSQATSIAEVVARVKPSVVAINTEVVQFDVFNRAYTTQGAGSGWIISEEGIIVTNYHVVEDAETITVTLDDGQTFPVDLDSMATDPLTDLAVLKIEADDLPAVTIGDSSELRLGDWVVAIGNSLGEGIRVTQGIVSRQDVTIQIEGGILAGIIETDAAINPGNSGGPLLNLAGEVIGITNAKAWDADIGIEGVGYAISTETAMSIIESLVVQGYFIRPWLGVDTVTVTPAIAFWNSLSRDSGVVISYVYPDSPAANAGFQVRDIIVRFNGVGVTTAYEVEQGQYNSEVGDAVEIVYWRGDTRHTTQATLIESPPPED
jgi:serine protease Do